MKGRDKMRWRKKNKYHPNDGDIRIITKFLIIPKCVDNEYRWMEFARIEQRYKGIEFHDSMTGGYWLNVEWSK